jgi:hypothetical protein
MRESQASAVHLLGSTLKQMQYGALQHYMIEDGLSMTLLAFVR